ncbi:LysE family transporter [Reichenbachiella sp.]|uniref:LysE family transporter n=1 Tax=Reichenbachiella sp. TaxID=2184521 RepID=UPI003B5B1E98
MSWLILFGAGFFFSFIGSIPPGSINISALQYALEKRIRAAYAFAVAAAATEYLYAAIAVRFQIYLTESADISQYFQMITGSVLILLGVLNLFKKSRKTKVKNIGEKRNAFKKGILLSLANPLAIPFWLMVTAYLQSMGWIVMSDQNFWIYVTGISTGTFCLLATVIKLGTKFNAIQGNVLLIYRVSGLIFIGMGVWSFVSPHQ